MKMFKQLFLLTTLAVVVAALAGCEHAQSFGDQSASVAGDEEPLLLEDEEPLLLLDDDPDAEVYTGPMADNSRCLVCHINFKKEELSLTHAKAEVSCADCHGESDEHIADESWASGGNGTAPDIMYPKDKINAACMKCHEKIDPDWHEEFLAGKSEEKYCTDCHGEHAMAERKCKWK